MIKKTITCDLISYSTSSPFKQIIQWVSYDSGGMIMSHFKMTNIFSYLNVRLKNDMIVVIQDLLNLT